MLVFTSQVFLFTVLVGAVTSSSPVPVVSIDAGNLEGGRCTGASDAVYFKGIPYAQPPTGDLRFASPEPYSGKYPNGSRLANSLALDCIQFGTEFAINNTLTSEDW